MQSFLVVYREYPTRGLIFLSIHTRLKARVYTRKNQVTRGILHSTFQFLYRLALILCDELSSIQRSASVLQVVPPST